ncbi:LysE family translocator [Pseudomonas xantholysinigenes]|uniref:LysE family translocator n=1 Tax=Pseudomonas xantholysinigenes TaxID=2745490 RepID=A0A9E6Q071_9PSED|nr:LysE family translocator [Pseudomonas xantholysinigenes]QXI40092.1 LysE family translocator [Pseudomonas xantholysinigenes]
MLTASSIWLFIIPFAIAAAIPGPAQGALLGQVVSRGARSTLSFVAGMVLGNAVWLLVATLGLAALAVQFEQVFVAIKWLGVAFVLFMAWNLWSSNVELPQAPQPRSASKGLLAGVLLTLGNPKAVVFFGAVLPHAFDLTALSAPEVVFILALGIVIDLTIQLAYLLAGARLRRIIQSPHAMKRLNRVSAGTMTGCAGWMAISR